jgi:23S rRNA-/tRNA-specific pseudouridylate synthase
MAFEAGKVLKTYLAFVRGCPEPPEGSVELALHSARKGKMRPALPGEPGALPSRTDYRVLRRWRHPASCLALVEARPRSGRSHQIRVHLRAIGCPILGDPIYGGSGVEGLPPPPRMALHAACLELPPLPGIPALVVEAPLPADLDAFTRALEEGFPLA